MIMNSKAADCLLSKYVSETVDYREDCTQCNKMYSNKTQRRFPYSGRSVRGLVDSRTLDQWLNIPTLEQRVAQALLTYVVMGSDIQLWGRDGVGGRLRDSEKEIFC